MDQRIQGEAQKGVRKNQGKLRWRLLPWDALTSLLEIYEFGAEKYEARGWEKGYSWEETFDSLQRHLLAWYFGERLDPESGKPHLAHAVWNTITLLAFELRGIGKDDRVMLCSPPSACGLGIKCNTHKGNQNGMRALQQRVERRKTLRRVPRKTARQATPRCVSHL